MKKTAKKKAQKKVPSRDITSFVTRQMLLGNISTLSIDRFTLEKAIERYCADNPRVDPTAMPLVGVSDKGNSDPVNKAILQLAKKHCGARGSRSAVFSPDGNSAIIFGKSAREIVSRLSIPPNAKVMHLKTKMKVACDFPVNRKLECFGGERVADHIKMKSK